MSNRNFDASTIINILKAQIVANFQNRKTDIINSNIPQLPTNPQSVNYSNEVITEVDAGSQAYYFKGYPLTTAIFPIPQVLANTTDSPPPPPPPFPGYLVVSFTTVGGFTWVAPTYLSSTTITYVVIGGGGGAGGSAGGASGGGGGAGSVLIGTKIVVPGRYYSGTVGAGGIGSTGQFNGGDPSDPTNYTLSYTSQDGNASYFYDTDGAQIAQAFGGTLGNDARFDGGGDGFGGYQSTPVSPATGGDGGDFNTTPGGGGGGAGGDGGNGLSNPPLGGLGGIGISNPINTNTYGIGGAGGSYLITGISEGLDGLPNTGNGGNALSTSRGQPINQTSSGAGGSGAVLILYYVPSSPPPSNYHVVVFAAPTTFTWTAPTNIFPLTISYVGVAGGGGAGGSAGGVGGGGGGAGCIQMGTATIVPGATYTGSIGNGGNGGYGVFNGGDPTVGANYSVEQGIEGGSTYLLNPDTSPIISVAPGARGMEAQFNGTGRGTGGLKATSPFPGGVGGTGGDFTFNNIFGGGGGGGAISNGGQGGNPNGGAGGLGLPNSIDSFTYGAGGAGGSKLASGISGGANGQFQGNGGNALNTSLGQPTTQTNSGRGANGIVIIAYYTA